MVATTGPAGPQSSAVRTDGNWVPVAVPMSASSAAASASQADRLRDLQSSQPAISATTRTTSRAQPRAPSPSDSAAAGVPAATDVGAEVGARLSRGRGWSSASVGRSAEVGVRVEVGVVKSAGPGAVASVSVVRLARRLGLARGRAGAGAFGRGAGRRVAPAAGIATAEPQDQAQHDSGQEPCRGCSASRDAGSHSPVSGRGHDPPRQHPRRPHRGPPPDRPGGGGSPPGMRRGHSSAQGPSRHHPKRMRTASARPSGRQDHPEQMRSTFPCAPKIALDTPTEQLADR